MLLITDYGSVRGNVLDLSCFVAVLESVNYFSKPGSVAMVVSMTTL